jgi:hypothetical protein
MEAVSAAGRCCLTGPEEWSYSALAVCLFVACQHAIFLACQHSVSCMPAQSFLHASTGALSGEVLVVAAAQSEKSGNSVL